MPPNPPSNAHGFAMRSMSLRDMQIPKSEKKKFLAPPLPNPGDAPANIMKMRKMFYFYISMDSRVKIGCFLNNIVVIAQEILVLSQSGV